jgi:subtilisin-like proprotein convertase family protein
MKYSHLLVSLLTFALALGQATAAITVTYSMSNSTLIPDGDLSGIVQTINVSASGLASIDRVTVHLLTSSGWNGDLYAYLAHSGIISVLINRPGRTVLLPDGSPSSGMNLTFSDNAVLDHHLATGEFNGVYQPDGRNVHPLFALDTDSRTTPLSLFNNTSPTGDWHLFIADVASGEEATLLNWSISIAGEAIPETSSTLLVALSTCAYLTRRRR